MEIWDGSRGRGSTATVIPLKVLGLTLVELSTLPGYLAGTQPHKLSVSVSIQHPVGCQAPRETWAARAQGAMSQVTFPLQQRPGPQSTPELLLCGTATDFQASSEVSPQSLNFPVSREKWRGSLFHLLQLHRLPLFGGALAGAPALSLSLSGPQGGKSS